MNKLGLIIILILSLSGCKSKTGNITEVKKQVVFPGVQQGKTFMKYTAKIELYKPVTILSVSIDNGEKKIAVKDFSIIDLKSGKIMKNNKPLPEGIYYFDADLEKNPDLEKDSDFLLIEIQNEGKTEKFKLPVKKADAIMRR
jgi:hypothetical protein